MRGEYITLTTEELRRLRVIQQNIDGLITVKDASLLLGLSTRQVKRLKRGVLEQGPKTMVHGNRGRKPVHSLSKEVIEQVVSLAVNAYPGYNFHHLRDILEERHNISLSVSSVRRALLEHGFKSPKTRRSPKRHRSRPRRKSMGELIQVDASRFHWLGKDLPMISLVAAIDDATGTVLGAVFRHQEDFWGYAIVMHQVVSGYGVPVNLYSDRHSIFQSPKAEKLSLEDELAGANTPLTQFGRALASLNICHTLARSPQAKGRIERLWETLQDRLTKELALANIKTINEANIFLNDYLPKHNTMFAVKPACDASAFAPAPDEEALIRALSQRLTRIIDSGCSISLKKQKFQLIDDSGSVKRLKKGTKITLIFDLNGCTRALYQDSFYDLKPVESASGEPVRPISKIEREKAKTIVRPNQNHPWKKWQPGYFGYHPSTLTVNKGDIFSER
jgi:transposase